jgi:hypothetical protein
MVGVGRGREGQVENPERLQEVIAFLAEPRMTNEIREKFGLTRGEFVGLRSTLRKHYEVGLRESEVFIKSRVQGVYQYKLDESDFWVWPHLRNSV